MLIAVIALVACGGGDGSTDVSVVEGVGSARRLLKQAGEQFRSEFCCGVALTKQIDSAGSEWFTVCSEMVVDFKGGKRPAFHGFGNL